MVVHMAAAPPMTVSKDSDMGFTDTAVSSHARLAYRIPYGNHITRRRIRHRYRLERDYYY